MNDGWDDDLDLDLTLDTTKDEIQPLAPAPTAAAAPRWEEDEELFGNDEDVVADDNVVNVVNPEVSMGEGWRDDEDDLNFDVDKVDNNHSAMDRSVPSAPNERSVAPFGAAPGPASAGDGGWEGDEELFGDNDEEEEEPEFPKSDMLEDLKEYVGSLSRILSSINAVLEYEYNTPEKAHELVEYYSARPGLAEYTRTREVPRMNYQVILPSGHVETNKQTIAQQHMPDHSLISRAANQSLLADLLQVLTGPDLVVRPQFLAVCVAQTCQFRLHVGDQGRDMVQCNCMLQLSLPVEEGPRLNIATLRTTIAFSPHQPIVKFRVDKIVVMLKENQYHKLQQVVNFLKMMEGHLDELPGHEDLALQNAPAGIFRDAFLEQSQQLMTQSTAGMKSALKEMESVIGLKSKFQAVRGGISKFLPDTNVLLAAEEEARALAAERERQQQSRPPPPRGPTSHQQPAHPPPPQQQLQQHRPPPPQMQARPAPASGDAARPKSILGGLVSSGWSALAKTVAIPDEDLAIYGEAPPPQQPMLYRKEPASAAIEPTKLNRSEPPPRSHVRQEAAPQQYRKEPLGAPAPAPRTPPPVQSEPPPVGERQPPKVAIPVARSLPEQKKAAVVPAASPLVQPSVAVDPPDSEDQIVEPETDFGEGWDDDLDLEGEIDETTEDDQSKGATSTEDAIEQDDDEVETRPVDGPLSPTQVIPPPSARMTKPAPAASTTSSREPDSDATLPTSSGKQPTAANTLGAPRRPLVVDMPYNADDDIIPTRKRWVNPRPNRPYLFQ